MPRSRYLPKGQRGVRVRSLRPESAGGCPNCGKDITPGRKHMARDGLPCKGSPVAVVLDELPPVFVPPNPPGLKPADQPPKRFARGVCHDCGKRVTGERWYCGACSAQRQGGK